MGGIVGDRTEVFVSSARALLISKDSIVSHVRIIVTKDHSRLVF